eukprot:g8990.t1
MQKSASLLLLCLAGVVLGTCSASVSSNVLHTKERPDPQNWEDVSETSNFFLDAFLSKPFKFRFSLKQQNMDKIKQIALDVSNPKSGQYGKYLTQSEIDELTKPDKKDVATVRKFIETSSSNKCTATLKKEILDVECENAHIVQNMLKTKFHVLQNRKKRAQNLLRAKDFYLPIDVNDKVHGIFGLHGLPLPPRKKIDASSGPASVTPSVIEQVYHIKDAKVSGSSKNRQAVAEFQGQTMTDSDLTEFFKNYVPKAASGDDKVYKFVGDPGEGSPGVEASLDIQYIMGVAPGVKTEFWYFASNDFCGDLKNWTGMLLANDDVPLVTSVSYGWQGSLSQIGCHEADVTAVDNDFSKLAAKGITIIFASGDSGSGYAPPQTQCSQTTGKKGIAYSGEILQETKGVENAFQCLQHNDQEEDIANYFKIAPQLPPSDAFNKSGRATPDVAALGEGFQVITGGQTQPVGGTSASAPTFAAVISLLNEARLSSGKPPLGYLNPWLYGNPAILTDIVKGNNAIGRGPFHLPYGFNCTKGYDPVSGLGTPDYEKMLQSAMKL